MCKSGAPLGSANGVPWPGFGIFPHSVPSVLDISPFCPTRRCPWVWDISPFCPLQELSPGVGYLPVLSPVGTAPGSGISPRSVLRCRISPHSVPSIGYLPAVSPVGGVSESGVSPHSVPVRRSHSADCLRPSSRIKPSSTAGMSVSEGPSWSAFHGLV